MNNEIEVQRDYHEVVRTIYSVRLNRTEIGRIEQVVNGFKCLGIANGEKAPHLPTRIFMTALKIIQTEK